MAVVAEKQRDWQIGKVLDSQRLRYFAGTVGSVNTSGTAQVNGNYGTYQGNTNTSQTAVYRVYETFLASFGERWWKSRRIARLGTQYVLGLRAKSCQSGDIFDEEQIQAAMTVTDEST
jgi:hypothetical protein